MFLAMLTILLAQKATSFPLFDLKFEPIQYAGDVYDGQKVIEMLQLRNPKSLEVVYRGKIYTPMQFLREFPQVPDAFQLQKDGEILDDVYHYLPWPHLHYFPLVFHEDKYHSPQSVIEILAKHNPAKVMVHANGDNFTPKGFLRLYPDVPKNFFLYKDDEVLEDDEIEQYIPWDVDDNDNDDLQSEESLENKKLFENDDVLGGIDFTGSKNNPVKYLLNDDSHEISDYDDFTGSKEERNEADLQTNNLADLFYPEFNRDKNGEEKMELNENAAREIMSDLNKALQKILLLANQQKFTYLSN